ncbi:MAG: autotransporter domain-containing protein [Candidatus Spyradosoma sp.]
MRSPILTKTALLAAGLFSAATLSSFAEAYDPTQGGSYLYFQYYEDGTVEFDNATNYTCTKYLTGSGTIVKNGEGTLQLNVDSTAFAFYQAAKVLNPLSYMSIITAPSGTTLSAASLDAPMWTGGELIVNSGTVRVTGALNRWIDGGSSFNTLVNKGEAGLTAASFGLTTLAEGGSMAGVDRITLNASARLDVGETHFDPMKGGSRMVSSSSNTFVFLNNLRAGENNDQSGTILYVGYNNASSASTINDRYHVNIHVDAYDETRPDETLENGGSIGSIVGDANIYKTGGGSFALLAESAEYTGNFYAAGGSVVLKAPKNGDRSVDVTGALKNYYGEGGVPEFGRALWTAESLNIASTIDPQNEEQDGSKNSTLSENSRLGANVRERWHSTEWNGDTQTQTTYYKEAYFTDPAAGSVVVCDNQAIRNFQAMFANGAAATDSNRSAASAVQNAADNVDVDAPIIAGTGKGSYLAIAEGATLAVYQQAGMGGIYKGTICGTDGEAVGIDSRTGVLSKGGTFVKYGEGDLALILEGANYEKLVILEGKTVVVNVTAINLDSGSYDWTRSEWVRDPAFYVDEKITPVIIENATSTLKTRLNLKNVEFGTYAYIDTAGGQVDVSDSRTAGRIEVAVEQHFVTGVVSVRNGVELILTADDLAGTKEDSDFDGVKDVYVYSDVNGSGTVTDAWGRYDVTRVEKDLETGRRVYYYTDHEGNEQSVEEGDEKLDYTYDVEFSGGSFGNAAAVVISGKIDDEASGKSVRSTVTLKTTDQKLANLTGDGYSKVDLGSATLTVECDAAKLSAAGLVEAQDAGTGLSYGTFNGSISGVGNLVKTGAGTLTLGGGKSLSYMGATVIAEGGISATKSGSFYNSSALVLAAETSASFSGAQNLVALFGADSNVTLNGGELRLGADASRRSVIDSELSSGGSVLGLVITDDFGNSSTKARTFTTSTSTETLVTAYLKPFTNLADSASEETREAMQSGVSALSVYLASENAVAARNVRRAFFDADASDASPLTKAEITRIYLKLLQANGLLAADEATDAMIDRLAFDGSVSATSISKIGDDRATLSGKVEAKSLTVSAGALEIDADALASAGTFADGVTIAAGATFVINTEYAELPEGVTAFVFDKVVSGDGNFEKLGSGNLVLGANVVYYGTTTVRSGDLTMTLRSTAGGVYSQGSVFVEDAGSTLTFDQASDTLWNGTLTNAGDLVKAGAGALEMRGENSSIAGGVAVKGGSLLLADVEISGAATRNAVSVAEGTTLTFEESGNASIDRAFEGEGTLVKAGAGTLTLTTSTLTQPVADDEENFGTFSGDFTLKAGEAVLATKNVFDSAVSVNISAGATLRLTESQTFSALNGDSNGTIYLDSSENVSVALTLDLDNGDRIGFDNAGGVYRTTVTSNGTTQIVDGSVDYSAFTTYSGKLSTQTSFTSQFLVGGDGALVFSGEVGNEVSGSNIELSVKDKATLITSVLNRKIKDLSRDGSVILAYDGDETDENDFGYFSGEVSGDEGRTLGKIGSGTLVMVSAYASSWENTKLRVYEGTLVLKGASSFKFASAVVVEGATLALECVAINEEGALNTDLSSIEGSGTIRLDSEESWIQGQLNISSGSMLGPKPDEDGRYFNGVLDAGSLLVRVTEEVALCSIRTTGGFDSSAKVTFYQAHDTTIGGSFSGNIEVTGSGVLTVEDSNALGTILVNDGSVCIDASAEGLNNSADLGLRVKNDATVYLTNTSSQQGLSGVELRGAVKEDGSFETLGKIQIIKTDANTKTLDFLGESDGGRSQLNVEQALWDVLTGENRGNASLSFGVSEGTLVVSGLDYLADAVGFVTYGAGRFEILASAEHQNLNRSISGDGSVAFRGGKTTTVSVDQAYTGETTIASGAVVKFDNVALRTSTLTVEPGGRMTGGVRLVGTPSRSVSSEARVFSASADPVSGGNFVNGGTVTLNVSAGDRIEYAGSFDNTAGIIRLTGAAATKRGYEIVLFKSLSGATMTSEQMRANFADGRLTNGSVSSELMLAQTDGGVISAFSLSESFALTEGLHDGLSGSFTAVLDKLGGLDIAGEHGIVIEDDLMDLYGPIGAALNRDSADRLADDVANLSPIGFASMIAMARSSFANDVRAVSERASHRRFDSTNEVYDNGAEFFARVQSTLRDGSKDADGANFDFNTYGALVGADVKPDDYSLYGVALGYDYGSATLHGGGGKIRSESLRATAFFSALLGDGTFFADAGVHVGMNRFETDRSTLVGKADGDADGWNFGAFASFGKGIELAKGKYSRLLATPYVGLEYLYSRVGSFDEDGVAGLDVDSFDANSLVGRLGIVFDWQFQLGDWEARLSFDAAYAHEFLDDETDVDASFRRVADTKFRATGTIGASDTFSFAPSLTVDLSEHNSLQFGYVLEYGTDEQLSHNFNAGFRRTF